MATQWWQYVQQVSGGASQIDIARKIGIGGPTVSRWSSGQTKADPDNVAAFARAYGRPVLEAFIAAGFLTAEEAGVTEVEVRAKLTNEEFIAEVVRRLTAKDGH